MFEPLTKLAVRPSTGKTGVCCAYFCRPVCKEHLGSCSSCIINERAWSRLAAYEATGFSPEQVDDLACQLHQAKAALKNRESEITRLESAIARQAQQFKEAVNTVIQLQQLLRSPQGQRREEAEGEASCQPA